MTRRHRRVRPGPLGYAKMVKALMEGPISIAELMEVTGFARTTINRWVTELKAQKVIFIDAWLEDLRGNKTIRGFTLGDGKDKPRPRMTRVEIDRAFRNRRKMAKLLGLTNEHLDSEIHRREAHGIRGTPPSGDGAHQGLER